MSDESVLSGPQKALMSQLMKIAHGDYATLVPVFRKALNDEPGMTARLCVWLARGGTTITDLQDVAILTLLQANPPTDHLRNRYRQAGRALLLGSKVYVTQPDGIEWPGYHRMFKIIEFLEGDSGHTSPRVLKRVVNDLFAMLQADEHEFEYAFVHNRKTITGMVTTFRPALKAGTADVIFGKKFRAGSKLDVIDRITKLTANPDKNNSEWVEKARQAAMMASEAKLPYRIAQSLPYAAAKSVDPVVCIGLIDLMTPTETANSAKWIEASGMLKTPEVRAAVEAKIGAATKSAAKLEHRKSTQTQDAGLQAAVAKATEKSVAKRRAQLSITRDVAVCLDTSVSMNAVVEFARQFGKHVAPLVDVANGGNITLIRHSSNASVIPVKAHTMEAYSNALADVTIAGWTDMACVVDLFLKKNMNPQTIVMVTDGGENRPLWSDRSADKSPDDKEKYKVQFTDGMGRFAAALAAAGYGGNVIVVGLGRDRNEYDARFSSSIENAGIPVDTLEVDSSSLGKDYAVYENVALLLTGKRPQTVFDRVMETEIPEIVHVK